MSTSRVSKTLILPIAFLLPAVLLCWLWWPPIARYHVSTPPLSDSVLTPARTSPPREVLSELTELRFEPTPWKTPEELIAAAEQALQGHIRVETFPESTFHVSFDAGDLTAGPQSIQLANASLLVPLLLLDAYEATSEEKYFLAAEHSILGWASYERRAWLPRGFLWNDHAMAARILVLIDFWKLYRGRPDYRHEVAVKILEFVERAGTFLVRADHFTVTTNHGVMENLALLQICIAFPQLAEASDWRQTAVSRLKTQLSFYISDEGVVLEHSAGYHAFGCRLMLILKRCLELLQVPVPHEWERKFALATEFYNTLRRPDGTLPMFGDTDGKPDQTASQLAAARGRLEGREAQTRQGPGENLYPVSGFAIWRDLMSEAPAAADTLAQTVISWSYFPGFGHKHADELSINFWASGQSWWNGVGYWSYDEPHQNEAVSWPSSNAPHLVGEMSNSSRKSELLFHSWSPQLAAIDVERSGPGDYVVRRQVFRMGQRLWLVLDASQGGGTGTSEIIWNSAANLRLSPAGLPGSFRLTGGAASRPALDVIFLGSHDVAPELREGSLEPFGGWQVVREQARPAPAIVLRQPSSSSWTATLWSIRSPEDQGPTWGGVPSMKSYREPDEWTLEIPLAEHTLLVTRDRAHMRVVAAGRNEPLADTYMSPVQRNDIQARREVYLRNHAEALLVYPRIRDWMEYRAKVTVAMLVLFFSQTLVLLLLQVKRSGWIMPVSVFFSFGWLAAWWWLAEVYLSP